MLGPTVPAMFLPRSCPICRRPGPAPCDACIRQLRPPPALTTPVGVDHSVCLFAYEGVGRELIQRLKYANHRDAVAVLCRVSAETLVARGARPGLVTWVPTSDERRRRRGFDQAEVLASHIARDLSVPCQAGLRRCDPGHQTGRSQRARSAARFAPVGPTSDEVLVVDDVRTTGSSLAAAAAALREAGAEVVWSLTLAATPLGP